MNIITLISPELRDRTVTFKWRNEPSTTLYRQSHFTLRFPETVDLSRVPEGLWWRIALICLHSQWALLRPCRVVLPIRLLPGEAELWCRLIDAQIASIEAYRYTDRFAREVEIIEHGPRPLPSPVPDMRRCATAFSGGKDSLLQTGLLAEVSQRPILVTTTSPMPPLEDHITPRRREILSEIVRRRPVTLFEVESDYRANFDLGFAQDLGYPLSVNELTDTFVYLASLLAVGYAEGATHLFLASETEVQENLEIDGRVIQHSHLMYSVVTQSALRSVLEPWGIHFSSLTSPLHSYQVQELLWTRYRDLRDLQYSCWRVKVGQSACNACSQCLRIAFSVLAMGEQPGEIGLNLTRILVEMEDWKPKRVAPTRSRQLPTERVSAHLHAQIFRSILASTGRPLRKALLSGWSTFLTNRRGWSAIRTYRRLHREAEAAAPGPSPGFRKGFLTFVDPTFRDSIGEIYAEHFTLEPESEYADVLARCSALAEWIAEPLKSAQPLH